MKKVHTIRAVIIDDNNNIPILKARDGEYYKIPGGTIEKGEDSQKALDREALEEAGCEIKIIKKIGEHESYAKEKNKTYYSTCYLAKLSKKIENPSFDEWEKEEITDLLWVNINDAIEIFKKCNPTENYEIKIHNRDLNFIKQAKKIIEEDRF